MNISPSFRSSHHPARGVNESNLRPHVSYRPPVIPNEAGRFFLHASLPRSGRPANVRNLSYGLSGGFSAGRVDFTGRAPLFAGAGFPTVKYLRIFSRRFGPSPRIASKSSTLLNAPYDFRICKIFSAVAGPIPGTCCNSSDVAVLMFTGFGGGFFLAELAVTNRERIKHRERRTRRTGERSLIGALL